MRFRQLREATVVWFRVDVVRRPGRKSGPREGGKNAAAGVGEGEGEMETGLFGPLRPAWAGQLREKFPLLLPTQTGMTHVAAIHRCPDRDRRTRGRADGRTDGRSLPASSAAAAYRGRSRLSYALRQSRVAVCTYAPPLRVSRDFFCFPWQ